jgi:GNAT superfamily N-acetyltransferase
MRYPALARCSFDSVFIGLGVHSTSVHRYELRQLQSYLQGFRRAYARSERGACPTSGSTIRHDSVVADIRRCLPDQREHALSSVIDAFAVDPLLRWVWPGEDRYTSCARSFFGFLLDMRMAYGEVWVADGGDSVAMWDPPGGLYVPDPQRTDDPWAEVYQGFSEVEGARWATYDEALRVPEDAAPYWYLGVVATRFARQGTGLGRAVLAPILAAADRTFRATYLETASDANLRFYGQLGFAPVREAEMPDGPMCWLLRRDPRPAP